MKGDNLSMEIYAIMRERIKQCLDEGWKKFIIFPFGENGMLVNQILKQAFGIKEIIIVDNELAKYNSNILSINILREKFFRGGVETLADYVLVIASVNSEIIECAYNYFDCKKVMIYENSRNVETEINSQSIETEIGRYSYGPLAIPDFRVEKVGAFCSFATGSSVVWNHQLNMVTNHDFIYENAICENIDNQKYSYSDLNRKFVIGNDVWLGKNVILTNGIKIGNGVRVGAGAVVTKDLPDYAIAVGVPARIIGYRFTPEQIEKLNKIAWWEWPIEKIKECYDDFIDIDVFLEKHYSEL